MTIKLFLKTYTDKCILLPREEFSWQKANKVFQIRLGFLFWDFRINVNF